MKNIFEKKTTSNPFEDKEDNKGDEIQDMQNEIKEEENIEETTTEVSEEPAVDEQTEDETAKLKADLENINNQYLRLAADFDNFRKRQAQEREALLKYGAQECMKKIIELVDNFDRAIESVDKIDDIDKMKETFFILNKQLNDSLTKLGLEQIKSVGEKFNPNLHEAVMQTQTDEYPEETIIKELQKGYKMGDKVLRPAMVDVAVK